MLAVYANRYDTPKWQAYVTPEDAGFLFDNGFLVASLFELKQALLNLPEDVIAKHLTADNNHIADWVESVVGDSDLAEALRAYTHRWGMVVALERQLMRTLNLPPYVAKRWLAQTDLAFHFVSGERVASLEDLARVLETVADESVEFHLERTPNDIAKWVHDVIGDYELGELLTEAGNRAQMQRYVADHLEMLREAARD